jgi:hypothetical protein
MMTAPTITRKPPAKRLHHGLVGLPSEPPVQKSVQKPIFKVTTTISEDGLRRQFGIVKKDAKPKIPGSYRQLLNLDPQDIINFFDVKMGEYLEFAPVDFVVPPSMLENRIRRLQKMIACSKQIIEGMASRIIKIRRGKDDPLLDDKATRETYKREENARIARCNARIFRYRTALHSGKDYNEKIWRTISKPLYFRDLVDDHMAFETATDVRWEDTETTTGGYTRVELVEYFHRGFVDLEAYRAVMSLGEAALVELGETEAKQKETWQNITHWENAVIRASVYHKLITPRHNLADLLGLGAILDEDDDYVEADTTEDALATKTGGACYGGRIKGEGFRYTSGKPVPRALSSFDKPLRDFNSNGDHANQDTGFQSLKNVSDDAESYDPR